MERNLVLGIFYALSLALCRTAINAIGHFLNSLHHLFEHRFLLKKDNLACHILKCFFGDFQPFIDQQEQMSTVGSTHLLYLPSQVLRMPETNQLDQDAPVFIMRIDQHKIWHHDRICEQEHLAFTRELPVSSFAANLLLKLASKICFEPAVKLSRTLKVGMQRACMIETIDHLSSSLGWIDVGMHAPLFAEK